MKMMGWLSKLIITAILLSTMSVMTTIYIVDQYVKTVLDRFQLSDIERPALQIGDLLQGMSGRSVVDPHVIGKSEGEIVDRTTDKGSNEAELEQAEQARQTEENQPELRTERSSEQNKAEATPVFGGSIQSNSLVMTLDEFNEKRKNLSDEDKMIIFSIMMNKLPQSELQKLSEWLEDGITQEEMTQVEDVINAYLEQEDIDKLLSILNSY